ncbi:Sgo1p PWA37_001108 [Arxiozyma heterogenica]|uniref:Sgo1p n=1 Tax=Arxiozyma heterogenica TaxID=278026 RepID=UPI002EF131D1
MVRYMRPRRTSFPDELSPDKFSIQSNDKQKNNTGRVATSNTSNTTTTITTPNKKYPTNIPIQELENLFHIKKERKDTKFMNHLQQNIQFAKENNLLKIKINELESRLNNLLRENLNLKQQNSINELQYKKTLNEQINILEYGMFKRFDEIILMFDNIRKREHLSINLNPLWNKYHPDNNNNNNNHSMPNPSNSLLTPSKKRNRRKSMFIQSDDLPSINNDIQNNPISQSPDNYIEKFSIPILKHPDNSIDQDAFNIDNNNNNNNNNNSSNSNSSSDRSSPSILDYSIPEEPEEKLDNSKQNDTKKNNTKVQDVSIPIPIAQSNDSYKQPATPSESITKKNQRKRTKKHPPRTQKITKKSISKDDIMPNTTPNIDTDIDINKIKHSKENSFSSGQPVLEGRSLRRSTRGKVVNYKLPSLRAKMRRPTEKLVDATIVNDIHEYEVSLNKNTIVKEEPTTPPLKHMADEIVSDSNQYKANDKLKKEEINFSKDKSTKLQQSIPCTDQSVIINPDKHKLIASNPKSTALRKKTEIYNDLPQDSAETFSEDPDAITQEVKSNKLTTNKPSKKRDINSILDNMGDKKNNTNKRVNLTKGECLKMKHTFDLKSNKNLVSPSSSPFFSISVSSSKPFTSGKLSSSNNNNSNSSNQILSDITNKNKPGKQITKNNKKKLLKTAIINDLYNDAEDLDIYDKWNKTTTSPSLSSASSSASFRSLSSSFHYQEPRNNNKENRTISFRFSDDDLSVFDLLDKSRTNTKKVKAKCTKEKSK